MNAVQVVDEVLAKAIERPCFDPVVVTANVVQPGTVSAVEDVDTFTDELSSSGVPHDSDADAMTIAAIARRGERRMGEAARSLWMFVSTFGSMSIGFRALGVWVVDIVPTALCNLRALAMRLQCHAASVGRNGSVRDMRAKTALADA